MSIGAGRMTLVHRKAWGSRATFYFLRFIMANKVLSCFIDESGDFGEYDSHSPFYMVSIVLHEQSHSIQSQINGMEEYLSSLGYRTPPSRQKGKRKGPLHLAILGFCLPRLFSFRQYHYTHENVFLCFYLRALCFQFAGFCFLTFPECIFMFPYVSYLFL